MLQQVQHEQMFAIRKPRSRTQALVKRAAAILVPLVVDGGRGTSWEKAH